MSTWTKQGQNMQSIMGRREGFSSSVKWVLQWDAENAAAILLPRGKSDKEEADKGPEEGIEIQGELSGNGAKSLRQPYLRPL